MADGVEANEAHEAGAAFEQDEKSAAPGNDAVHFSVAKALAGEAFRRAFLDTAAIGVNLPASGEVPGARLAVAVAAGGLWATR